MRTPETPDAASRRHDDRYADSPSVQHEDWSPMLPGFEDIPDDPVPQAPRPPRRRRTPAPAPDIEPLFEIEEPDGGEVA